MTQATIKAKRIYRNVAKATGKKFTKILGTDSLYYIYWEGHIAEAVKDGYSLVLDVEPEMDKKGHVKVNKIISFDADSTDSKDTSQRGGKGAEATTSGTTSTNAATKLAKAIAIVEEQVPNASGYVDYLRMVSEVLQTIRSEEWLAWEREKASKGLR